MADVSDQRDGGINEREPEDQRCNFFRGLCKEIADDQPCITEEDDDAKVWIERAKCSRITLLSPIFTALLLVADVGMDCEIAATHYSRGDLRWAAYTLCVIVFSLIITDALSALFYFEDQADENTSKLDVLIKKKECNTPQLSRLNLNVKPWFYAVHFIFCGRLIRCFQIFKTVRFIRKIHSPDPANLGLYQLCVSQRQDLSILGVVEAFTEEAPQVALQLYVLVQRGTMDWTSFADVFLAVNIIKSLALFAFSLLSFCRFLRLGNDKCELLELLSFAAVFHLSWRLFMLVSRILVLVLFASSFKHFVFVVVGIHLLFSHFLLRGQNNNYFKKGSLRDILLRCAFTCINLFCFFPLDGERTRNWGILYYVVTFTENCIMTIMMLLCGDFCSDFVRFKTIMLITEWVAFLIGLVSLLLYYGVFHPSKKSRNALIANECESRI